MEGAHEHSERQGCRRPGAVEAGEIDACLELFLRWALHIWEFEKGRTDNPSTALVTRLADHFGVSGSYLVSEDVAATDADEELARMFRQAQGLDDRERKILDDMMQSLLRSRASRAHG